MPSLFDHSVGVSGGIFSADLARGGIFDRDLAQDVTASVPARGPAIAATIIPNAEAGSTVRYSWHTDIVGPARDGTEHRLACRLVPRETYALATKLNEAQIATLQTALIRNAATGSAFGIPLEHESLLLTGASGATANVATTALSDWAEAGQRAIVIAPNGSDVAIGVVQGVTATTIVLDVSLGAAGVAGARIMPVMPCYLEETQGMALYPVNAGTYELKARAIYFGNSSLTWAPLGATVTTYTDPVTSAVFPVYDKGLINEDALPRAIMSGSEIIDRGGVLWMTAPRSVADIARDIFARVHTDADRQYLKAFHGTVRGQQVAFLLPTWQPDLIPLSDASTSLLTVKGPPLVGVNNYAAEWFASPAHQHIQLLKTDGTVAYRTVTDAVNHNDGTSDLQLDSALAGALSRVSFLEKCRFATDDIVVKYDGAGIGESRIPVQVVQQ
jgi:hypothetical protein